MSRLELQTAGLAPSVKVRVGALVPPSPELARVVDELLAGAKITVDRESTSAAGWPLRVFEARVEDTSGNVVESRAIVIYAIRDHLAVVSAVTPGPITDDLRAALGSGRPRWEVTLLGDLLAGLEDDAQVETLHYWVH